MIKILSSRDVFVNVSEIQASAGRSQDAFFIHITTHYAVYNIDDFIEAGWKENKKLDNSNFQSTNGIWYGFFNRRDAEIWIYDSHSSAIDYGVQYAEEAINKRPTNRDPTNPTSIRYHAYLVTGNAMILCEDNLEDCIELLGSIK